MPLSDEVVAFAKDHLAGRRRRRRSDRALQVNARSSGVTHEQGSMLPEPTYESFVSGSDFRGK